MEDEWMQLPTLDKLEHKVWKARVKGYEECHALFSDERTEGNSSEFATYGPQLKSFATDANEVAREKALAAMIVYFTKATIAKRYVGDVLPGLINKCFSARAKQRSTALELVALCVEAEGQDVVIDELVKGCGNKQPKVVHACIESLKMLFRDFGPKVISPKPVIQMAIRLLDHKDGMVRNEAKQTLVECYRWIGDVMKVQLEAIKQAVVLSELTKEFEQITSTTRKSVRYIRSQKPKVEPVVTAKESEQEADQAALEENDDETVIDVESFIDPVDILSSVPNDFYAKITEKKWQERRDAIQTVLALTENPVLMDGDYGELIRALRKIVSGDTNVMVVALAAKCLKGLCRGLRKLMNKNLCQGIIEDCLMRCREKNAGVVESLKEAANAAYDCDPNPEFISETVTPLLAHKVPNVKQIVALFLVRIFSTMPAKKYNKKIAKLYVPPLLPNVTAADPNVRESAFNAIGVQMKLNESLVKPYLGDLDKGKIDRVMHYMNSDDQKLDSTARQPQISSAKSKEEPVASKASKEAQPKPEVQGKTKPSAGDKPKKKQTNQKASEGDASYPAEQDMEDDAAEELLKPVAGEACLAGMMDGNWKTRMESIVQYGEAIKGIEKGSVKTLAIIKVVLRKPGLKDSNFQALKSRLDVIDFIMTNGPPSQLSVKLCVPDLVDKLSDVKNGFNIKVTLTVMAENVSLPCVFDQVMTKNATNKSPKVNVAVLEWLTEKLNEFGVRNLNSKQLVSTVKQAISNQNPSIRSAAANLAGTMFVHYGAPIKIAFDSEKAPISAQMLNAEFEKREGEKPPAPTKTLRSAKFGGGKENRENAGDIASESPDDAIEDTPVKQNRVNISAYITKTMLTKLADKNWKVRLEGAEEITKVVSEFKAITPAVGDLMNAMRARITDSNKMVAAASLNLVHILVQALGSHVKVHLGIILAPLLQVLSDHKSTIRNSAVAILEKTVENIGLAPLLEGEAIMKALAAKSPAMKSEMCTWLTDICTRYPKRVTPSDIKVVIPLVYACLEDRNPDVRTKASLCLEPFIKSIGYQTMQKMANSIKGIDKAVAMAALDRVATSMTVAHSRANSVCANAVRSCDPPTLSNNMASSGRTSIASPTAPEPVVFRPGIALAMSDKYTRLENLKITSFKTMTTTRDSLLAELKRQADSSFSPNLLNQLFSDEFQQHICAMALLQKAAEDDIQVTISNLDIILKWLAIRFTDPNSGVTSRAITLLNAMIPCLQDAGYSLLDAEAQAIVPELFHKASEAKDNTKKTVRQLICDFASIYCPAKLFSMTVDALRTRNTKMRIFILDLMPALVGNTGIELPIDQLKSIMKCIGERDGTIRNGTASLIAYIHAYVDTDVMRKIGLMSEKDRLLIEDKIRKGVKLDRTLVPSDSVVGRLDKTITISPGKSILRATSHGVLTNDGIRNPMMMLKMEADSIISKLELPSKDFDVSPIKEIDFKQLKGPAETERKRIGRNLAGVGDVWQKTAEGCKTVVGLAIARISELDNKISVYSIVQIREALRDHSNHRSLKPQVDSIIRSCCGKLRHSVLAQSVSDNQEDKYSLLRYMISMLIALMNELELAKMVSVAPLQELLNNLLTILCPDNHVLKTADKDDVIIRCINVLSLHILNNSDATNVYCALITLLNDYYSTNQSKNQIELVMKCLWRMHRMHKISTADLRCTEILSAIDGLLMRHPLSHWQHESTTDRLPYNTIKSIVNDLMKTKQAQVFSIMDDVHGKSLNRIAELIDRTMKKYVRQDVNDENSCVESPEKSKVNEQVDTMIRSIESRTNIWSNIQALKGIVDRWGKDVLNKSPMSFEVRLFIEQAFNDMLSNYPDHKQVDCVNSTLLPFIRKLEQTCKSCNVDNGDCCIQENRAETRDLDWFKKKLSSFEAYMESEKAESLHAPRPPSQENADMVRLSTDVDSDAEFLQNDLIENDYNATRFRRKEDQLLAEEKRMKRIELMERLAQLRRTGGFT